jgi:hypothetical protein
MAVYVFYYNAHSKSHSDPRDICMLALFYQLPNYNLLPSMLFTLWRDTTSKLWTPVHSFTFLLPFTIYLLYLLSCKLLSFTTRYA